MARKQAVTQQDIDAASNVAPRSREVIYTIVVSGCTRVDTDKKGVEKIVPDTVKIERTRRTLHQHGVREGLIHIDAERGIVSVKRLTTVWQGDDQEQAWQRAIQTALPGCLIDVADWTPALGYPKGDIGTATGASK